MRRLLPLLASLVVLTPTTLVAQDSLDTYRTYYISLREAEAQYPDARIDQRVEALHALVPPPAIDSLHRELLNRADKWAVAARKAELVATNGSAACEGTSLAASSNCSSASPATTAQSRARSDRQSALSQYQKVRMRIYERLRAIGLPIDKYGRPVQ